MSLPVAMVKNCAAMVLFLDHDERYEQTDEFLEVWQELAAGRTVDHAGKHLRVQGARQFFPATQENIPLYFGGSSTAAHASGGATCRCLSDLGEPPEQVSQKNDIMRALAAEHGRKLRFGIRLHVIVPDTF